MIFVRSSLFSHFKLPPLTGAAISDNTILIFVITIIIIITIINIVVFTNCPHWLRQKVPQHGAAPRAVEEANCVEERKYQHRKNKSLSKVSLVCNCFTEKFLMSFKEIRALKHKEESKWNIHFADQRLQDQINWPNIFCMPHSFWRLRC